MTYFVWGIFVASEPIRIPGVIKFGEDFDFDFSAYTLRRSGRILKLERIPAEVLAILVENRGQIVSRENIAEKSGARMSSSTLITASTEPFVKSGKS